MTENNQPNEEYNDITLTDILQAHDILLSILLGNLIGKAQDPSDTVNQIVKMTDMQDINDNAKNHIKLLLNPIIETFQK